LINIKKNLKIKTYHLSKETFMNIARAKIKTFVVIDAAQIIEQVIFLIQDISFCISNTYFRKYLN
jgi:thymidylate kinase